MDSNNHYLNIQLYDIHLRYLVALSRHSAVMSKILKRSTTDYLDSITEYIDSATEYLDITTEYITSICLSYI